MMSKLILSATLDRVLQTPDFLPLRLAKNLSSLLFVLAAVVDQDGHTPELTLFSSTYLRHTLLAVPLLILRVLVDTAKSASRILG
jgi:hypothetical protein